MMFQGLVRLRDGVSSDVGDAYLASAAAVLARDHPDSRSGWTNTLVPLRNFIVPDGVRAALYVLAAVVLSVLLIACANVANLLLVHASGRARELALRVSLGASRRRIVQQLVVESALLVAAGSVGGGALALGVMRGLVAMAPPRTPFIDAVGFDGRFLVGLVALAGLAAIVSGVVPALSISSVDPAAALREETAGGGSTRRTLALRNVLVMGEVAAAVVLVTLAALFLRSFGRLVGVDPGVDVDRIETASLTIPTSRYPDDAARSRFGEALVARLDADPAIASAALVSWLPAGGGGMGLARVFLEEGHPEPPAGPDFPAFWNTITPDYFRTMGIPILAGRAFTARDTPDTTPVIIVSQSFARSMFGDVSPLGRRIRSWRDENRLREIVGVAADVKVESYADRDVKMNYVPLAQGSFPPTNIAARAASGSPAALAPILVRAAADVDPGIVLARVRPLADAARDSMSPQRYAALLVSIFSGVALGLAALGIYGVISYVVLLRRREMGIRLALGASRSSLYRLVIVRGFRLALSGLVVGVLVAVGAARIVSTQLFGTSPADAASWAAMAGIVLAATLAACLLPARRAARADPTEALKAQ